MNSATRNAHVESATSTRRTARIVGVLFLAGFLAYGVGNVIATSIAGSADPGGSEALLIAGVALMLVNSVIVIGIGVLMFPILRPHSQAIADGYLGTRIFEGVGCPAIGAVCLLVLTGPAAIDANFVAYNVAEVGLGMGRPLLLCAALPHRTRSAFPSSLGFRRLRVLRRGFAAGAVRRRGRRAVRRPSPVDCSS